MHAERTGSHPSQGSEMTRAPKAIYRCESCDAVLSRKRKYCDERCKQIELCKSMGTAKYKTKHVAPAFQAMIRAEAGAFTGFYSPAIVDGKLINVVRIVGECVCVTCGRVCPWQGGTFMHQLHCGHFLAGRGAILFEEDCVSCQCSECNRHHGGRPLEFRKFMEAVRGLEVIERLEQLKRQSVSWSRDAMVDKRIEYSRRLKVAEAKMKGL